MGAFRDFFTGLFETWIKEPISGLSDKITGVTYSKTKEIMTWRLRDAADVSSLNKAWVSTPDRFKEDEDIKDFYESEKKRLEDEGLNTASDIVVGWIGKQIAAGVNAITGAALSNLTPEFTKMLDDIDIPQEKKDIVYNIAKSGEFGLNAVVSFLLGVTLYPAIGTATAPVWRKAEQLTESKLHSALLPPDVLLRGRWRDIIKEEQLLDDMLKQGFTEEDIASYRKTMEFYPSASDLVTWQAKEVYEPAMITKYGLEAELEAVEKTPFYKAGMNDEQIRNFWIAHWQHPSWSVIRDMLFRTDLTEKDVWDWFKTVEIPPFWRDKFIETAYAPITRVDIRRLYQDEVIDREAVKAGYLALGSSPDNAESLTVWTEIHYPPKQKELTKSEILKNYRIGETLKETAEKMLEELGYETPEIEWLLTYEDYQLAIAEKKEAAELLVNEAVDGKIAFETLQTLLSDLGLTTKAVNTYLKKAKTSLRATVKMPSEEKLMKWFKLGIIDETVFKARITRLNYMPEDVERFVKEGKSK